MQGITGSTDNLGVKTITVPYWVRTLEECATVALGRIVDGLPEDSRTWQPGKGSIFNVFVIYKGQERPSDTPSSTTPIQTSIRGSYSDVEIEYNPDINEIIEKYGGRIQGGKVIFDPTYEEKATSGIALLKGESKTKKNPFFGLRTYPELGVTFTRTYVVTGLPSGLLTRVGKVVGTPPGGPTGLKGRTRWLVMPPSTIQRGNVVEVTEEYQLLSAQTPEELYDQAS